MGEIEKMQLDISIALIIAYSRLCTHLSLRGKKNAKDKMFPGIDTRTRRMRRAASVQSAAGTNCADCLDVSDWFILRDILGVIVL